MATQCKLYRDTPQLIPPNTWTLLTFDKAIRNDRHMQRNLSTIMPPFDGDFIWYRFIHWDTITVPDGDVRERQFMERFVRDPNGTPDSTGSTDGDDTAGKEYRLGGWPFYGEAGEHVGVQVWHDHTDSVAVVHAQFIGMTWDY